MTTEEYRKAATEAADLLEQLTTSNAAMREKHESALIALEGIANMPEYDQDDAHRLRNIARVYLSNGTDNAVARFNPSNLTLYLWQ